jgi:polysaccharide biosynthesis transport protein
VLRTWAWVLIASVLLAGGAAYLVSSALPKTYASTATLLVGQSLQSTNPDPNQLLVSQRLSQTYASLATTTSVLAGVVDTVGLNEPADVLRKNVVVTAATDSTLITITATDGDPQRATTIANTLANALIAASPAISGRDASVQSFIDSDLKATQQQITEIESSLQSLLARSNPTTDQQNQILTQQGQLVLLRQTYTTLLGSSSNSGANLLTLVDPAIPATQPSSPRVLLNTILAGFVGLLIAIGIAFFLEYLDDTVKSGSDVEALVGAPTLGAIIRMKGGKERSEIYHLAALLYPRSPAAEGYRTLRTNVEFAAIGTPVRTLLVTSSIPGEGKTTTAANLAVVFAQAGRRTLLLDADLRKPGVHKMFNLQNSQGLTSLLRSDDVDAVAVAQATEQENLAVITTGPLPPNPAELLRSPRMKVVLDRLTASVELVIIDSPPLRAVTDAAILASITDGTIFVIDAGRTRRGAAVSGRDALAKVGARVLGVTLNRLSEKASGDYYYYDYHGGYGSDGAPKDGRDETGRDRGQGRGSVPPVVPAGVKRE